MVMPNQLWKRSLFFFLVTAKIAFDFFLFFHWSSSETLRLWEKYIPMQILIVESCCIVAGFDQLSIIFSVVLELVSKGHLVEILRRGKKKASSLYEREEPFFEEFRG